MIGEEINKIICERLMGGCWHEFDDLICVKCKEYQFDVEPQDYCNSYSAMAKARRKIAERGLNDRFVKELLRLSPDTVNPTFGLESKTWIISNQEIFILLNLPPIVQAEAIVKVLQANQPLDNEFMR